MSQLAERISDSELEVMKVLWEAGEALPVTEIRTRLYERRGWEATTVKTLIARLHAKGALRQDKRNVYYYSPVVSEEEYNDWAARDLVTRLFKGSARELVATLCRSERLTAQDIEELRALFKVEE